MGMVFVLVGISAHPVWLGLIFSYIFGYRLQKYIADTYGLISTFYFLAATVVIANLFILFMPKDDAAPAA